MHLPTSTSRLTLAVLATLLISGCGQQSVGTSGGPLPPPAQTKAAVARLKADGNQLLPGGPSAFAARLAALRGLPVIVNQWASWCGPCRFEFPFFQHLSARYDGRVAFVSVDAQDARADAAAFLKKFPVPYPHFFDQDAKIARTFGGGRAWPTTAFFDARGKLTYTHVGSYATEAKLDADIRTHALDG